MDNPHFNEEIHLLNCLTCDIVSAWFANMQPIVKRLPFRCYYWQQAMKQARVVDARVYDPFRMAQKKRVWGLAAGKRSCRRHSEYSFSHPFLIHNYFAAITDRFKTLFEINLSGKEFGQEECPPGIYFTRTSSVVTQIWPLLWLYLWGSIYLCT
jgi:hypothetical protein